MSKSLLRKKSVRPRRTRRSWRSGAKNRFQGERCGRSAPLTEAAIGNVAKGFRLGLGSGMIDKSGNTAWDMPGQTHGSISGSPLASGKRGICQAFEGGTGQYPVRLTTSHRAMMLSIAPATRWKCRFRARGEHRWDDQRKAEQGHQQYCPRATHSVHCTPTRNSPKSRTRYSAIPLSRGHPRWNRPRCSAAYNSFIFSNIHILFTLSNHPPCDYKVYELYNFAGHEPYDPSGDGFVFSNSEIAETTTSAATRNEPLIGAAGGAC